MSRTPPFERVTFVETPVLVGARWWQESMFLADPLARRQALLIGAAVLGTGITAGVAFATSHPNGNDGLEVQPKRAVDAQRELGWSFGSETETLPLEDGEPGPWDRSLLDTLATRLAPQDPALVPYYVPTLFQAATDSPAAAPSGTVRLRDILRPLRSVATELALGRGKAMAELFDTGRADAIIVDLPGPEAVAFAAGLAPQFDPVFDFDNWPHPRGVVPSQKTLAAALAYAPLFEAAAKTRVVPAAPVFVLDAARLSPYEDASERFDNRYVARLPSADALKGLGVKTVRYVRPGALTTAPGAAPDLDDVNADLAAYEEAGIPVRMVAADAFVPDTPTGPAYEAPATWAGAHVVRRPTLFGGGPVRVFPVGFGVIGVLREPRTGVLVGRSGWSSRSGSWGRSGGGFFGG